MLIRVLVYGTESKPYRKELTKSVKRSWKRRKKSTLRYKGRVKKGRTKKKKTQREDREERIVRTEMRKSKRRIDIKGPWEMGSTKKD